MTANLAWCVDHTLDYCPTQATTVFGNLPCAIVDLDDEIIDWREQVMVGVRRKVPILIEIYVEISSDDTSGGRDASEEIKTKLRDVEQLFEDNPSIGGLVKGSHIQTSKVEKLSLEAVEVGVLARWAWVALIVDAMT